MNPNKRKPRIRNRRRNKANRLKAESAPTKDAAAKEVTDDRSEECDEKSPNVGSEASVGTTEIASLVGTDAIRTIQRLMRQRMLQGRQPPQVEVRRQKEEPIDLNGSAQTDCAKAANEMDHTDNGCQHNAYFQNIQKKIQDMMASGDDKLHGTLLENLQKLFTQGSASDVESDGEEEEYIEYIFKSRKYGLTALCNVCKTDLSRLSQKTQCSMCQLTFYCGEEHMHSDMEHRQLCMVLQQVAIAEGGHIFQNCSEMTANQFRSFRIMIIRKTEMALRRPLSPAEQEAILFPRLCMDGKCRRQDSEILKDCDKCGMVAFCAAKPEHLAPDHGKWCDSYKLFKEIIMYQEQFGRLEPPLPSRILKELPLTCSSTQQIMARLGLELSDGCEFAALSQISTAPLTAWYALKLCGQLSKCQDLVVHLIGAEIEFEVDVLHKWELFFLHLCPTVRTLSVVFVGPELGHKTVSFEQLRKMKSCGVCRRNKRTVSYHFEPTVYHTYCVADAFLPPNLICFFNAGLYRSTGYNMEDTWPATIRSAAAFRVPIVVTAYTEYESPLDMSRFLKDAQRDMTVIMKPSENPFASVKPERNFISDDEAPLMFKNNFCFVLE